MKHIFQMLIVVLGLWVPSAHAGGVSDGGGNTMNPTPAQLQQVVDVLEGARKFLFIKFVEESAYTVPFTSVLFHPGGPNIYSAIMDHPIHFELVKPCKDKAGNDVDGSIDFPQAGMICMSVMRIAQKTNQDTFALQAVALLAHEYSHYLGLNEADADFLQAHLLKKWRSDFLNSWQDAFRLADQIGKFAPAAANYRKRIGKSLLIAGPQGDNQFDWDDLTFNFARLDASALFRQIANGVGWFEMDLPGFKTAACKHSAIEDGINSLTNSPNLPRAEYEAIFGSANRIDLKTYVERRNGGRTEYVEACLVSDVFVTRLDPKKEVLYQELVELNDLVQPLLPVIDRLIGLNAGN